MSKVSFVPHALYENGYVFANGCVLGRGHSGRNRGVHREHGSRRVSGYQVGFNGTLFPLNHGMPLASTRPGTAPIDMAQCGDGRFLYVLDGGVGAISAFEEHPGGRLSGLLGVFGFPASVGGLVAQ